MRSTTFILSICAALAAGMVHAKGLEEDIIAALRKQGYAQINVTTTLLGRTKITAINGGNQREIVINPRTGEILRDLLIAAEVSRGTGLISPGSSQVETEKRQAASGSTKDNGSDDNSGSGSRNSGSGGSGNSGSGDGGSSGGGSSGGGSSGGGSGNSGSGGGDSGSSDSGSSDSGGGDSGKDDSGKDDSGKDHD